MASPFIAYDCFVLDLGKGVHNFSTDTLKLYLSNNAPNVVSDTVYGAGDDLSTAGGYTAGGISLGTNTWAQIAGLASLAPGSSPAWVATSGFGPFRYLKLYNFTASSKPLICYYDNGSSISIAAGKDFDANYGVAAFQLHF
jgi:hypothetical protein